MLLVVAAALNDGKGNVLVQERPVGKPMAGLWEFPGGKVEPGETPELALVRELHEELHIEIIVGDLSPISFATHPLGHAIPPEGNAAQADHLLLLLYGCSAWQGEVRPQEGQKWQWVDEVSIKQLPMPEADIPLLDVIFRSHA